MSRTQIRTILLLIAMICHAPLFSQKNFEKHEFSFHVGHGNMFNDTPTLTLGSDSYQRELAKGVSWDGQYNFRPVKRLLIGAIYSGFSSQGSHPEGSDHLWINFIGTQIGLSNANTKHWQIRMGAGPGLVFLRNNSEVFGKSRRVKAKSVGLLINSNATYKLTSNLGIGIGVQYMISGLARMKVRYHDETHTVWFDDNYDSDLSRLNISAGLSYYF